MEAKELLDKLGKRTVSEGERWQVIREIRKIKNSVVQEELKAVLRKILEDSAETKTMQQHAMWVLGWLRDQAAFEMIVQKINDRNPTVYNDYAMGALIEIDENKALSLVEQKLAAHPNSSDRSFILYTILSHTKNRNSIRDILVRALKTNDDLSIREEAATTLGYWDFKESVEPLLEAFNQHKDDAIEQNGRIRASIALSLGRLKTEPALQAVKQLVEIEPNAYVKNYLIWALGYCEAKSVEGLLVKIVQDHTQTSRVRATAIDALAELKLYTPLVREALSRSLDQTKEYSDPDLKLKYSIAENAQFMLRRMDKIEGK